METEFIMEKKSPAEQKVETDDGYVENA